MSELWVIIVSLPFMPIVALFFGFEPAFYYGISLFGLAFWMLVKNPRLKTLGIIVFAIFTVLFFVTFTYYIISGAFFPEKPFEFKIPRLILSL